MLPGSLVNHPRTLAAFNPTKIRCLYGPRDATNEEIAQFLAEYDAVRCDVPSDGDCFFHVLIASGYKPATGNPVLALRALLSQELLDNEALYTPFWRGGALDDL